MIEFIAQWGYLGLLVTSFIAGLLCEQEVPDS